MSESVIRRIEESDVSNLVDVLRQAYPGVDMTSEAARKRWETYILDMQNEHGPVSYHGLWRDKELVGAMRLHDFVMNMRSQVIPAGGVGMVAVDFGHKKEHIGKDLIHSFLTTTSKRNMPIAVLYAFRTDFYHQMGFGFGPMKYQYTLPPSRFPKGDGKHHVRILSKENADELSACYTRCFQTKHGLIQKTVRDWEAVLTRPNQYVAAYIENEQVNGYFVYTFKPVKADHFGVNNLHITELQYETPQALAELFTFIHSQADQIKDVVLNTQDDSFYHLIPNANNGSDNLIPHVYHETCTVGVGLMYRVVNTELLFDLLSTHNFGNQTCRVKLTVDDSFLSENNGSLVVWFQEGYATVQPDHASFDVEVRMNVAEFSSLVMGVIGFQKLVQYGRVQISDAGFVGTIQRLFNTEEKPVCTTGF